MVHARQDNGKVLRDIKTFRSLMRSGKLKYNTRNLYKLLLKYYGLYARNTNTPHDVVIELHFIVWDVVRFFNHDNPSYGGHRNIRVVHNTPDFDSIPIAFSVP